MPRSLTLIMLARGERPENVGASLLSGSSDKLISACRPERGRVGAAVSIAFAPTLGKFLLIGTILGADKLVALATLLKVSVASLFSDTVDARTVPAEVDSD